MSLRELIDWDAPPRVRDDITIAALASLVAFNTSGVVMVAWCVVAALDWLVVGAGIYLKLARQ